MRIYSFIIVLALLAIGLVVFSLVPHFIKKSVEDQIYSSLEEVPEKPVALVLGAKVYMDNEVSDVLQHRLDSAIELYESGKVDKILLSGKTVTNAYNESFAMLEYMKLKNIPVADLIQDEAGKETFESISNAKHDFGFSSMIIVSQKFHLPRALYIANRLGLDTVGFTAGEGSEYFFEQTYQVREKAAMFKAVVETWIYKNKDGSATVPIPFEELEEAEPVELPKIQDVEAAVPEKDYPESLNISVPFYTQAPYANWNYPWQEACEEASVLLVANLYNKMYLNRYDYNQELLRLVDWEMEVFGAYEHTSVKQTVEMIEANYDLETVVHENPDFENAQEILSKGHLIVAPFAGKLLYNPNFLNGGPVYHMIVIKGYDESDQTIITHDVGTRNGADYVYTWAVIEKSLHDWNGKNILEGPKRWIEVIPPSSN